MTWKDITIEKFLKIQAVISIEKEPFERTLSTLAVIKGIKKKELDLIPLVKLQKELRELKFLDEPLPQKIHINFKVKGRTFRACTDISKINTAQYIELMDYAKENPLDHIHHFMAILCDEVQGFGFMKYKVPYSGEAQKEKAELFYKHLAIDIAYPQSLFFCNVLKNLMPSMQTYLEKQKKKLTKELQTLITNTGGGMSHSTSSARAI